MIKLNNKNITYVALADSANSIKAPKEIWYADSNNSVKLVYRRKDALIEGEDYEKYHWLVSNSEDSKTPYIDTLIPPNLNQNIASSFKVINSANNGGEPGIWGAILSTSWSNCVIRCFKPKNYGYTILEYNNNNNDFPQKENMIIKTEFSEGKEYDCSLSINSSTTALGVINNESKELVANSNVNFVLNPQPTYKLFVEMDAPTWSFNSVGFKKFSITNLISLIPCKLLKPIPKWLDANGIRRQVGECGMIDLVSGKFYGNVNSVGTFTVENYYERKEWLRVQLDTRGSAMSIPIHSRYVSFNRVWNIPNNSSYFYSLDGSDVYNYYADGTFSCVWYDKGNTRVFKGKNYSSGDVINILTNQDSVIINDEEITWYGTDVHTINFALSSSSGECDFLTSSITVNDKERYIPCTLTMDLPASMDANNIARTKGTSGMWDLVSDRFYGNVANSGMFKAVNLAEGVDYEVHQWLGAEIPPQSVLMTIEISDVFNYSRIYESIGNSSHLLTDGYNYYTSSSAMTSIGVWNGSRNVENKAVNFTNGLDVICTQDKLTFNSVEFSKYGFPASLRWNNSASTGGANTVVKTSSITVDGIKRYIPVKLLKSIPSKYDANGIARQAGECGMYDTVNDKFYGNVAGSGTFSVEGDS